ncbi:hypothetical protein D9M71_589720 [compost metagenome]
MEEYAFQLVAELALPATFEFFQQRLHEVLAEGAGRVDGQGAIEQFVQAALVDLADGGQALLEQGIPWRSAVRHAGAVVQQQVANLAYGDAASEPGEDVADLCDLLFGIQTVPLRCALRDNQAVAPLPGTQCHRVHASTSRHLADRQLAVRMRPVSLGAPPDCRCIVTLGHAGCPVSWRCAPGV